MITTDSENGWIEVDNHGIILGESGQDMLGLTGAIKKPLIALGVVKENWRLL